MLTILCFADLLLDDCLVAENAPFQPDGNSALLMSDTASPISGSKMSISNSSSYETPMNVVGQPESTSLGSMRYCSVDLFPCALCLSVSNASKVHDC